MPAYRCKHCQEICKEDSNNNCATPVKCNFERVEVIHLASEDGTGRKLQANTVRTVQSESQSKEARVELKLHCASTFPNPKYTTYPGAVTCPDCLTNLPVAPQDDE